MEQVSVDLRNKIIQDWMQANAGVNGSPPAWAAPYISGATASPALFDAIAQRDPAFIERVVGNVNGTVSGNTLSFQGAPDPGFGDDWLAPAAMIAAFGIAAGGAGNFSQLPGAEGGLSGGGSATFNSYGGVNGPSPRMEDYATRVAAEDLAGGQQFLQNTGQTYNGFLQNLTSAGVPAAAAASAAANVGKGFGLSEALRLAGVAAPLIGALISSGAIKDASQGQTEAAGQAIGNITGATGAAQDRIQAGLDSGLAFQKQTYDQGVTSQNASLDKTLADLTGRYNEGVTRQEGALDLARSDLAPYRDAGAGAITRLSDLLGTSGNSTAPNYGDLNKKFTLADFWDDPVTKASYQSGLDLGTKALNNSAARAGSLNSGGQAKALARFGTDYTGGQAAGSQARFVGDQNNTYNRLTGVSNIGQNAVNSGNTLGFNTAANIANQGNQLAQQSGTFRGQTAGNIANSGNLMATNAAQLQGGAATNIANLGVGQAQSIAQLLTGAANARGAASIAGANNTGNAINNAANWWSSQETLDRVLGARK